MQAANDWWNSVTRSYKVSKVIVFKLKDINFDFYCHVAGDVVHFSYYVVEYTSLVLYFSNKKWNFRIVDYVKLHLPL
ncbi:hypothetical protein BUALT_Bualt15G0085900 [Buddleja alternifolia]|uniref:Uncharacterized protein n=1 Tax=Buddleja alternifolia TaxID=168488 RepID=A0AAV6WFG8_9LAMI|nr:hypothetical protein BUALT_Bualt15G0085900 [Buddleja alternifolia]